MDFSLDHSIALLERTPGALDELLCGLPDAWTQCSEGEGTWTAADVIRHLIKCERENWMPRLQQILTDGESQPFKPFVRVDSQGAAPPGSLAQSLQTFAHLRADNLTALRALELSPADLDKRGLHPTFGPVTAAQLLATWTVHDLTHLHQLSRILAHQYSAAVGPWSKFLGVLHCEGHSS